MPPVAWVLNFDAEDELGHPGLMTPATSLTPRVEMFRPRLGGLVEDGDLVLDERSHTKGFARGLVGHAWCMTPRAVKGLVRSGATPAASPGVEVLRVVNHRAFSARLSQAIPGAAWCTSYDAVMAMVRALPQGCNAFVKRPWGHNGRGRRRVRVGAMVNADHQWIVSSIDTYRGLQCEPEVKRTRDLALHGSLQKDGSLVAGDLTVQSVDDRGQWIATTLAPPDVIAEDGAALNAMLVQVADALREAGYWGPFGIDAFRWVDDNGRTHLQPLSEINARYSMGYCIGMGARARDLLKTD